MNWQDTVNGLFECLGGAFLFLSIIKTYREKQVKGISIFHVIYFTLWGWWNLYYYPHLGQTLSFAGGIVIVVFNTIWLGQILVYSSRRRKLLPQPENH